MSIVWVVVDHGEGVQLYMSPVIMLKIIVTKGPVSLMALEKLKKNLFQTKKVGVHVTGDHAENHGDKKYGQLDGARNKWSLC